MYLFSLFNKPERQERKLLFIDAEKQKRKAKNGVKTKTERRKRTDVFTREEEEEEERNHPMIRRSTTAQVIKIHKIF
jgi:hypothetical protein